MRDWGFESGGLGSWLQGGEITSTLISDVKNTGNYAIKLGGVQFAPALNISNSASDAYRPDMAIDSLGTVHVVWHDQVGSSNAKIHYACRESNGAWSSYNISGAGDAGDAGYAQITVDRNDIVHVAWYGYDHTFGSQEIYYTQRESGGSWSTPLNISKNMGDSYSPELVADKNGTVHIVWYDFSTVPQTSDIFYSRRESNGVWSNAVNISNNQGHSVSPQLSVDGSVVVHLVWQDTSGGTGYSYVFYAQRENDGTWSVPHNVSGGSYDSQFPKLAVENSGTVHIVWDGYGSDIYYARRGTEGNWSSPLNISSSNMATWSELALSENGTVHVVWNTDDVYYAQRGSNDIWSSPQNISNNSGESWEPVVAVDDNETVHVAWYNNTLGNTGVHYARRASNGVWSSPYNVSSNAGFPQLAVDQGGYIHIVWGNGQIYYVGPSIAEQTGDSIIAQTVTVPLTMSNPILSLLYQLGGASSASGSWFNIQVDNGISATLILSTTSNMSNWTHRWFDLTPWAGQTITLTFNLHQTAGTPAAWAYLDEVTLGSAYPDLWLSANSQAALPGEQAVYRITYGDRGGAPASGVRISATLPSELLLVDASPPPVFNTLLWAWEWDVGDLSAKSAPYTIVLTTTVAPTATLFSTLTGTLHIGAVSPEIETANNAVEISTFVGRRTYLPILTKDW